MAQPDVAGWVAFDMPLSMAYCSNPSGFVMLLEDCQLQALRGFCQEAFSSDAWQPIRSPLLNRFALSGASL